MCFNSSEEELKVLIESTLNAIQLLKDATNLASITIHLVDNSEENNLSLQLFASLQKQIEDLDAQLHLLYGHGNVGYGAAHNLVINNMESDYHLLLNPDLQLDQNCLVAGVKYLAENQNVAMVSPLCPV